MNNYFNNLNIVMSIFIPLIIAGEYLAVLKTPLEMAELKLKLK